MILFGASKVDFAVGGVDVTTEYDVRLRLPGAIETVEAGVVEFQFEIDANVLFSPVGKVDVEEKEISVIGDDDATFVIKTIYAEAGAQIGGCDHAAQNKAGRH